MSISWASLLGDNVRHYLTGAQGPPGPPGPPGIITTADGNSLDYAELAARVMSYMTSKHPVPVLVSSVSTKSHPAELVQHREDQNLRRDNSL